jgi:polygalacturonase
MLTATQESRMDAQRRKLLTGLSVAAAFPMAAVAAPPPAAGLSTIFDVRGYGAKGDGKMLDSPAINAAVEACAAAGGGTVYLAPGIYHSGIVVLKSNVTLYLEAGAVLLGSTNIEDYALRNGAAPGAANHLIYARDAENVTVRGPGRIDGQGAAFWRPSGKAHMPPEEGWNDVLTRYWEPNGKRPSPMLEFQNCRWVRIEDVRIENAASWTLRTLNCGQVFIRGVSIKNPVNGPNTDGMDICGCTDVLISDCSIDTGDDAICLKSENPLGPQPLLTRNVVVTNCVLTTCCNGFKLGTNSEGGFENITFSNSVIYNNAVDLNQRVIAGIALEVVDGGWIDGVVISNIRMQRVRTPIFIRLGSRAKKADYPQHGLRGVMIDNVHASEAILASSITGLAEAPVEDVSLSNIRIDNVAPGRSEWANRAIPENAEKYPESRMFGMLPVSGLYCRHVRGLHLSNVGFRSPANEQRPTLMCEDVEMLQVAGLRSSAIDGQQPTVKLVQCKDAWITQSAAATSNAYLGVAGGQSGSILLSGCDLRKAKHAVESAGDVPAGVVTAVNNVP